MTVRARAVHRHIGTDGGLTAAETPLPQAVADDRDGRAGAVFFVRERPADERPGVEDPEEIRGDAPPQDLFGRTAGRQVRSGAARGRDVGEDAVARFPIQIVRRRRRVSREPQIADVLPHHDDPIGIAVRQRPEQHVVDGRENRGVGADAEGQGQDRDRGEPGRAQEQADAMPEIGDE